MHHAMVSARDHVTSSKMDVWLVFKERLRDETKTESRHGKILPLCHLNEGDTTM